MYVGDSELNGLQLKAVWHLTLDERMDWPGGWLRDSSTVLFFSNRSANFDIFEQRVNARTVKEIVAALDEKRTPQLTVDSLWIVYLSWPSTNGSLPSSGRLMRVQSERQVSLRP